MGLQGQVETALRHTTSRILSHSPSVYLFAYDRLWCAGCRAIYQLHLVKVEKVLISFYAGCSHTSTTEPPMSAPGEVAS